ncbi:hypothetical protein GF336_05265 [Candidatus Woesearchaeota archaeon]|nr:hypothetical protein [Candidatus Woesearchaeota archaeon]
MAKNNKEKIVSEDTYSKEDNEGDFNEKKTSEDIELEMEIGKKDEEVYSEEGRESLVEDDEMEPWEEGFMEGAEGRGEQHCCSECGKLLGEDESSIYERKFDGELKWFCSEEHAENYAKKHENE